jgi:hypothetical protein
MGNAEQLAGGNDHQGGCNPSVDLRARQSGQHEAHAGNDKRREKGGVARPPVGIKVHNRQSAIDGERKQEEAAELPPGRPGRFGGRFLVQQDGNPGKKRESGEIAHGELAEDKLADAEGSGENEQQQMTLSPVEIGVREYLVYRSLLRPAALKLGDVGLVQKHKQSERGGLSSHPGRDHPPRKTAAGEAEQAIAAERAGE